MLEINRHNNIKPDCFNIQPAVLIVRAFTEESLQEFTRGFINAESTGQEIIPIQIDSWGGNIDSLLGMIDIMDRSKRKICTFTSTKAYSAGSMLLAAGTPGYRFASKNSSIMLHEMSAVTRGKQSDMANSVAFYESLNKKILALLDRFANKESEFFKKKFLEKGNTDLFLSPTQAVNLSLVDQVKSPTFEISVEQRFNLV